VGAAFPSTRAQSRLNQGANFIISDILKGGGDPERLDRLRKNVAAGKLQSTQLLAQFKSPTRTEIFQQKAEADFIGRIQAALNTQLQGFNQQLQSFTIPQQTIIQTPMIESESQVKQETQSPNNLIPIAIIALIAGVVLFG